MRILPYYIVHTFINSIKKLFKSWVIIMIAIIFGMGLIGGVVGGVIGSVVDEKADSSSEEAAEEKEDDKFTDEDRETVFQVVEIAVGAIFLLIVLLNIYSGDKSGAKIFTMPDVNFLFSAPMKPQSVLLFRTVLQMGLAIVSSLYLLFQIPNLVINVGLGAVDCICIFAAWIMMLFIGKLATVCTYTLAATYEKLRKYIRPFVITVISLILLAFAGLVYIGHKDILTALSTIFTSKAGRLVPLFGWFRGFVMSILERSWLYAGMYFVLLIAACVVMSALIWRIKADFYEDALSKANETQEALENAKTGTTRRKKDRSEKISRNENLTGDGARVFFTKIVYNRKRFAKFGIMSSTAGTYTLLALASCAAVSIMFKSTTALPAGFILLAAIFFRNLGNPIADETAHNFIFMVPESPYKKLYYTLLGGIYEAACDLIPAFVITEVMTRANVLQMILWFAVWVSLDAFCSSVGLFIELTIPSSVVPTIKAMFGMMIRMIAVVPGLLIIVIGTLTSVTPSLGIALLINLAVSAILFALSPRFLHLGKN